MDWEESRNAARNYIERAGTEDSDTFLANVKNLAGQLRDDREFDLLDYFTEELRERGVDDAKLVKFQAQSFIDRGKPGTALVLLKAITDTDRVEAHGLMGRAWKQIFFNAQDKTSAQAKRALKNSMDEYKTAYQASPDDEKDWAGVNLISLAAFTKRQGIETGLAKDAGCWAREVKAILDKKPADKREVWDEASKAEVCLGLDDLDGAAEHIGAYIQGAKTTAFALGGTLRQFTDLWQLDKRDDRGLGIVQALRAALCSRRFGHLELTPDQLRQTLNDPSQGQQLQKILGDGGLQTYEWLRTGFERARSIGAIRHVRMGRMGTGFLVSAEEFFPSLGNECLVMTNAHVVSDSAEDRALGAIRPAEGTITFEAVDTTAFPFSGIIWHSPVSRHDCVLLRLVQQPSGILPLRVDSDNLQPADGKQRVYVIGYPGGRDLAFSLQDNLLLDQECPPNGQPPDAAVRRVQYRAPTEPGSSGSPVFEENLWRVVALHHAGGKAMPKLNCKPGRWPANEGLWIQSIVAASQADVQSTGTDSSSSKPRT
jgi:Trypsin-like peptidase domain